MKKYKLLDKIITFSDDNCSTDFRSVLRKEPKIFFNLM